MTSPDRLIDEMERCVAMGFNAILMPPLFRPSPDGNLFLTADYDTLHPAIGEGRADDYLAVLAEAARARNLALYLDLVIDRLALDGIQPGHQPEWFRTAARDAGAPPDPRDPPEAPNIAEVRFDVEAVARAMTDWWAERLAAWTALGVSGFRCKRPDRVPAIVWQELMAFTRQSAPECVFFAWTPGIPLAAQEKLAGLGFDAVFSSARWWDFRSPWLVEEHARQRRIAPSIAFPEEPFGERLAGEFHRADEVQAACRRALWLAAFAGDGLLIPMGYEYAARRPLDAAHADPNDLDRLRQSAGIDLTSDIAEVNGWMSERSLACGRGAMLDLAGGSADAVALLRTDLSSPACSDDAFLLLANADLHHSTDVDTASVLTHTGLFTHFEPVAAQPAALSPSTALRLAPGEVRVFKGERPHPIIVDSESRKALEAATHAPRIAIENVQPTVDEGRFPVKRVVGERLTVEADIFGDGHDELAVELLWRPADRADWSRTRMVPTENDRWRAEFPLDRLGTWLFTIEAWRDEFSTLQNHLKKKLAAGVALRNDVEDGRAQVAAAIPHADDETRATLRAVLTELDTVPDEMAQAKLLLTDALSAAMKDAARRAFLSRHPAVFPVWAERLEARFASWYELFPRSQSGDVHRHGTFDDVIKRLPAIRDMGFDVLYMPPIHPIGRVNRKGRNNSLTTEPGDPGSPYAIGSAEGGHTDIHPELGTLADFRRLRDAARDHGLELALDFAIQCSPDHPWVKEHPDWFKWQADGTLHYAENPPKKYEDITNVEFYAEGAAPELWLALESVVLFWVMEGVRIFRVDNPHTKPYPFWEWLIGSVRARHPDVIFLSEAFTAPKRMYRLAKLGFSQSYTYFTWRHTKAEFAEYLTELNGEGVRDFFRPNFFVNTPDINPPFLQTSGRPGHLIRAALATLLSGLWGVYSGFELCEATPLPGREEYLNSEKYEIRAWDWSRPGNIVAEIAQLNRIRKANPALHTHLGLEFYNAFNDQILYFAKATPARDNVVLAAINLDPFRAHEAAIELPLWEWGLADHAALRAEDLMRGHSFVWHGKNQTIRLDPAELPFAVWRVRPHEEL